MEATKKEKLSKRITEIDLLRGIAVLLMIVDHFMYDLWGLLPSVFNGFPEYGTFGYTLVKAARFYWSWDVRTAVRYVVLFIFLGLTGVSCSFSRSNLKRGLKLLVVAMILTGATFVVGLLMGNTDFTITFGVLHCIALALIVIGLLEKLTTNRWVYFGIGVVLTAIGIYFRLLDPPFLSYSSASFPVLFWKMFVGIAECGSDCFAFPLNAGQIFIGVFLGKWLYAQREPLIGKGKPYSNNLVTFVGRHSLLVYFAHQIILPLLSGAVLLILGYTIAL